jgi:hypothetical protein
MKVMADVAVGNGTRIRQITKMPGHAKFLMEQRRIRGQGLVQRGDGREFLELDLQEGHRRLGLPLAARDDGRDRLARIAHAIDRQDGLILIGRSKKSIIPREVIGREDGPHARRRHGGSRIDALETGMRQRTAPQFGMHHTWQADVGDKHRASGDLLHSIGADG